MPSPSDTKVDQTVNTRFSEHVRSASFALTLSAAQINELLLHERINYLRAKYHWYQPGVVNFGSADEVATEWTTPTIRALVRKGLVNVVALPVPCSRYDVIRLTEAGRLTAALLEQAGFEVSLMSHHQVPPHPDDRIKLIPTGDGFDTIPSPGDRRDPADARWCTPFLRS